MTMLPGSLKSSKISQKYQSGLIDLWLIKKDPTGPGIPYFLRMTSLIGYIKETNLGNIINGILSELATRKFKN